MRNFKIKTVVNYRLALALLLVSVIFMLAIVTSFAKYAHMADGGYPYATSSHCTLDKSTGKYIGCVADEWGFYKRECTSFVAWKLNAANGVYFVNGMRDGKFSNASNWGKNAIDIGFAVNDIPAVGSVAWWNASKTSPDGHVAWVSQVDASGVYIEEYNNDGNGNYNTRRLSSAPNGYIHIKDLSASTNSASLPSCNAVAADTTCIWRLVNNTNGYHFYTADINERNNIVNSGAYRYESLAFYGRTQQTPGTVPVYRIYLGSKHLWTTDIAERDYLLSVNKNAVYEGVAWYADGPTLSSGYNVYRLSNSSSGDHLWTTDTAERDNAIRSGWIQEGIGFYGASPMVADTVKASGVVNVYRVSLSNEHFYTASIAERDGVLRRPGAKYEGVGWTASDHANSKPVYRLLNSNGSHFWTTSQSEKNALASAVGWTYEGIVWYETDNATQNVYRLYNQSNGQHFWTADAAERDYAKNSLGYLYEGAAFYY